MILPFLPNYTYSIGDNKVIEGLINNFPKVWQEIIELPLVNPFKLWTYVVLITGVEVLGYFLTKIIGGKKGWLLTSIAGGFASSTATIKSLSQKSKKSKNTNVLLSSAILANLVSFIQVSILIGPVNFLFLSKLLPVFLIIMFLSLFFVFYYVKNTDNHNAKEKLNKMSDNLEIFNLNQALKFVGIFSIISIFSKILFVFFGDRGFLLATALGSFAGIDAVMINTAELAGSTIPLQTGFLAFILANTVNFLSKIGYSFLDGSKEFTRKLGNVFLILIIASFLYFYFYI